MPLVAHIPLPTFDYLNQRGENILNLGHALHQDIRELHIGFLNMMPDAALAVTERQFLRLVGQQQSDCPVLRLSFHHTGPSAQCRSASIH